MSINWLFARPRYEIRDVPVSPTPISPMIYPISPIDVSPTPISPTPEMFTIPSRYVIFTRKSFCDSYKTFINLFNIISMHFVKIACLGKILILLFELITMAVR